MQAKKKATKPVKAVKKEGKGKKATSSKADLATSEATLEPKQPSSAMNKALLKAGFVYKHSELHEPLVVHGYDHPSGAAAIYSHDVRNVDVVPAWEVHMPDGRKLNGKTAHEFVERMYDPGLPSHVSTALEMLRKLTKNNYHINLLAGDENYKVRTQLLKQVLKTDKVLAKDNTVAKLRSAFYTALQISDAKAAVADQQFVERCAALFKAKSRQKDVVKKTDKDELETLRKRTIHLTEVPFDGVVAPPAPKRRSAAKERKEGAVFRTELAARVARAEREEASSPIARPRSDAAVDIDVAALALLEDPQNGIVLLRLEKPNSQGAICVYNNGSRVAAGVVPTARLQKLRTVNSQSIARDAQQLLHPITDGVIVTPDAERHLTAVLRHFKKENEEMATTKKFAAPAGKGKKATEKKAVTATAKSKDAAPRAARASTNDEMKVVANSKNEAKGGFFKLVQEAAAKPITFGALITAVAKKVTLRSEADANTVVRVRTRAALTKFEYLKEA